MGVSLSTITRVLGIDIKYKNFNTGNTMMLPQRLAIIGQGNDGIDYPLDKFEVEASAAAVADKFGYGSPLHLAALQLFPINGESATFPVTIYPVKAAAQSAAASGTIAVSGEATKAGSGTVRIGGETANFVFEKSAAGKDIAAAIVKAINAVLAMPVIAESGDGEDAAEIKLTAKWSGELGNDIRISLEADAPGVEFTVGTNLEGGAGVASVTAALKKIGVVWETFLLNTLGYKNTNLLDEYYEFGNGRWATLVKKPCLVASGCTDDYATRTAITDARKTDYINFLVTSVGSDELPFVVAAKAMMNDIVTTANENPARGYKGLLTGLAMGSDEAQEDVAVRNLSVGKGASTNVKNGSVAELNDIITMHHPENEGEFPSKRYVADLVKLMNVVYNIRLIMESDEVKGAPLLPDEDITSNPAALQPKTVKTWFANLADSLADNAIIADAAFTKKNLSVAISSANPKRLDTVFPVKLSGNVEVASVDLPYGFYLG